MPLQQQFEGFESIDEAFCVIQSIHTQNHFEGGIANYVRRLFSQATEPKRSVVLHLFILLLKISTQYRS